MTKGSKALHLAGLSLLLALAGCEQQGSNTGGSTSGGEKSSAGGSGDPIVIAVAGPFTGNSSAFGEQIRMGVELGVQQVNEAGGINGRKIELNMQDDGGKADDAQKVATKIANDSRVMAVIGHFNSSCSLAGKELYSHAKMVMFSAASTNVNVTKDSEYVYRNIFTDDFQGQSLANYVGTVLNLKKVAILFDNDDYGTGLKESFKKRAQELGLTIVSEQAYVNDSTDFRAQLTGISGTGPDIILVAGLYNQAANIAKQAREVGVQTPFIGGDGVFSDKYIELAGETGEGTFVSCPFLFDLAGEAGKKFAEEFKKKYDREPDAWAVLSYDAFNLIVTALKKEVSREAVLKHLKGINSPETAYNGLAGKTYFDEEGDCKKPVQMAVVKGGKFVAAEKQLPVEGEAASPAAATPESAAAAATPEAAPAAPTLAAATPETPAAPAVNTEQTSPPAANP